MPQIHLRAETGDYAPAVLLPGDPNRATRIAEHFDGGLDAARRVNAHRALYGYTGTYHGAPVSVQTTGMGAPSLSIVVEELLRLGARRLIRVGTCGGIGPGIRTGDLVVATAATPYDGATRTYLGNEPYAPAADFELVRRLVEAATQKGFRPHVGQVCTVDVFYSADADFVPRMRARGILALEMETSALYYLAARAFAAGDDVRAATILTVSDVLSEDTTPEESYMPLEQLERAVDRMIVLGLEAAIGGA